jgi:tetratricopeptide (TPR) repeat protein
MNGTPDATPVRVFISYSWDSAEHKQRVLELAKRLRREGVDAWIDQFTTFPEKGWQLWMEDEIEKAAFVLVIASEKYAEGFNGNAAPGTRLGATWEGAIIRQDLYEAGGQNKKFLPTIFSEADAAHIPKPLRRYSRFCVATDEGYDTLYGLVTGQPKVVPGPIGAKRDLPHFAISQPATALSIPEVHEVTAVSFSTLHQLPSPPAVLIGRDDELADLEKKLSARDAVGATISGVRAGLQGMGGVGKTALALVLAHRLKERYPDAQLYLNLRGADPDPRGPVQPVDAMQRIIHAFHPQSRLPDTLEELSPLYRSVLTDAKRVLLLLDNAADADQIRPLLPPPNCLLLVTSRAQFSLPGLAVRNLDCLQPGKSEELLNALSPRFGPHTEEAAELCGHLPKALEVFAGLVNDKKLYPVPELLKRLRERKDKLEPVEAAFEVSYELLDEDLRRRWTRLSVFPVSFDLRAAAAVWGDSDSSPQPSNPSTNTPKSDPPPAALDAMQTLFNLNLVEWNETTNRFRLHDLVRQFCYGKLGDNRVSALSGYAVHYAKVGKEARYLYQQGGDQMLRALELFDCEQSNLVSAFEFLARGLSRFLAPVEKDAEGAPVSEATGTAIRLLFLIGSDVISTFGHLRFHPKQNIRWLEILCRAAQLIGDREMESTVLDAIGHFYLEMGESRKAIEFIGRALDIARQINDRHSEGIALGNLGKSYLNLGEFCKAIKFLKQASGILAKTGDRVTEAALLSSRGLAYKGLGANRKAIEFHAQALDIAREIGDLEGEGPALSGLAEAYAALGDAPKAIELFKQQWQIARKIHDRRGEASSLSGAGNAYGNMGDFNKGIEFNKQALAIYREINNRRDQGRCLLNCAVLFNRGGDRSQAITHAEEALKIFEAIEHPDAPKVREQLAIWRGE